MALRDTNSLGAPCEVEAFVPSPRAAIDFYGPLFGWVFDETEEGVSATLDGRDVARIAQAPPSSPPGWLTFVRVDDVARILTLAADEGGTVLLPPTDGDRAVLADPSGVPFGIRQAGENVGAHAVDEPNSWAMSSLHTPDLEGADAFYRAVFGWIMQSVPGAPFAQWFLADRRVAIATRTAGTVVPPHWSVNFAVRDADAIAAHASNLGGSIVMGPMTTPGFRNAVIAAPQGAVIAVSAATD